ncbi:MAG: SusD/RagB family nutrient-binding outer membrane lipoprotein [Pedobacter sp.]|nr:MAG: SusD/RagB family nutrient-binding outer membrane lipoprotein [Pedobacter sp.]
MKRFTKYGLLIILLPILSCKKATNGLNVSPNSPTSAPLDLVLNGAQVASIVSYEGNAARMAGIFAQSFAGSANQYASLNNYVTTTADYSETWNNLYTIVITQTQIIQSQALAVNNKTVLGIAQVMQAQAFGLAADLWGDVPFSQVGDPISFPQPKFDTQTQVYAGVQNLLSTAITNLQANVGTSPGVKDIFYGGNTGQWIAAANTLKARFYLHVKDYTNAITYANQGINDATGQSDMMAKHGGTYLVDMNLYNSFLDNDRSGDLTAASPAFAPSFLAGRNNSKTNETDRLGYIYMNAPGASANLNDVGLFGPSTPFPLITYSENQLILAEAYLKQSAPNFNSALTALNNHRAYLNTIYPGSYQAYVASDFSSNNSLLLKEIQGERYVTFIGQIEQFNDVRRNQNALGITPTVTTTTLLPQRFLYPQDEQNTNPNTPLVGAGDFFKPTTANASTY